MNHSGYAVGQAVFVRTDTVDYAEECVPFASLEDLIKVCSTPRPNRLLEKVVIFCIAGEQPSAVTLGFISATSGQKPKKISEGQTNS